MFLDGSPKVCICLNSGSTTNPSFGDFTYLEYEDAALELPSGADLGVHVTFANYGSRRMTLVAGNGSYYSRNCKARDAVRRIADGDLDGVYLTADGRWTCELVSRDAKTVCAVTDGGTVAENCIAGLDCDDPKAEFKVSVTVGTDGKPVVTWTPALNGEGEKTGVRTYRTFGTKTLGGEWTEVTDGHEADYNFFRVEVSMP